MKLEINMNPLIKCENCIFWRFALDVHNHCGVCSRYPEMKDLNTLVSRNVCLCHKYTESNHFCGEFIYKKPPYKNFTKML